MTEYNSALHRITSQLKLCKQNITDTELIEMTLSTFHASNLVLEQQHKAKNYATNYELISALLVVEKHNQLLMKNHNARPVGSQPMPEAHAIIHRNDSRCGRGRGGGRGNTIWSHRGVRGWGNHNIDRVQVHGRGMNNVETPQKPSSTQQTINQKQVCYGCVSDGHWSCICRTPKHLVEAYQRMPMDKKGKAPQGISHHACLLKANMTLNVDNDDFLKFDMEDFGDNE